MKRRHVIGMLAGALGASELYAWPGVDRGPADITGSVTNRITRYPVNGSELTFEGVDGQGYGSFQRAFVIDNTYKISLEPGAYKVTITGDHVPHVSDYVPIVNNAPYLSVLVPGRASFKIPGDDIPFFYDERFGRFLHDTTRKNEFADIEHVRKWNLGLQKPTKVLAVRNNLSDNEFDRFLEHVRYANSWIPRFFDEKIQDLPIKPVPDMEIPDGAIMYRMTDIRTNGVLGRAHNKIHNGNVVGTRSDIKRELVQNDDPRTRPVMLHETGHGVGLNHSTEYEKSVMFPDIDTIYHPQKWDFAAIRALYDEGVKNGNISEDTNRNLLHIGGLDPRKQEFSCY